MGEAKRRKKILGDRYGKTETSRRQLPVADNLMPDYGTYYVETLGVRPISVWIEHPQIVSGGKEVNIGWNAGGYLATLIVTPEFAEAYQQNPSQLKIIPDPNDAYVTPLGERVVPFKLVDS